MFVEDAFHLQDNSWIIFNIDLDQLNLILAIQGSPSQEDLNCILNDKVCVPSTISLAKNFIIAL